MKILKLFSIIALSFVTLCVNAEIQRKCNIAVAAASTTAGGDELKLREDLSYTNAATASSPEAINKTQTYSLNLYAVVGDAKYSTLYFNNIEGVQIVFEAGSQAEENYTLSFSNLMGEIVLYDIAKEESIVIANEGTYVFECAANEQYFFQIGEPDENIHHRDVASGSFGTICFPYEITDIAGATLLSIVGKDASSVYATEVALADMETGKAYIFEATDDAQSFTYDPESSVAEPIDNNGLVGTFAEDGIDTEADAWIIKGNAIKPVLAGSSVPQYRAYIPSLGAIEGDAPAGVVRRFLIGEATGLQEIKAMEGTRKAIVNGRLVIIREGRMFNALGGRK